MESYRGLQRRNSWILLLARVDKSLKRKMKYENKDLIRIHGYLSKKGIKASEEELLNVILKFAAEKEDELLDMLRRKRSEENLKKWLETPVKTEITDSLKEHDLV